MGIFSGAVSGFRGIRAETDAWSPMDDRWYTNDLGTMVGGGVGVSAETMLNCGVVLAAVRFRANIFSQSQPEVISKVNGVRVELPDHPVRAVLRDPNAWQTGVRWRHLMMMWAQTWGDGYSEIIGTTQSFADELRPLNPGLTRVLDQRSDGSLRYEIRDTVGGQPRILGQESVLHFRGPSMDGFSGLKMYRLIRNCVGIALLAEKHTSTFLSKGARIGGFLVPKGDIGDDGKRKELADSVNAAVGGPNQTGTLAVLPYEVDFKPGMQDNQKAQLLELRDFQVGDCLRFLDVPGVLVNWGEKTAGYASTQAYFEEGKRCVLPWVVNFEAEEDKALLPRGTPLQIKHNLDAILRADATTRFEAMSKATGGRGWITVNEARTIEDMNRIEDDESCDEIPPAPNQNGTESAGSAPPKPAPAPPGPRPAPKPAPAEDDGADALLWQFASADASRAVRREVLSIRGSKGVPGAAVRLAGKPDKWKAWAIEFYDKHAAFVSTLGRMTETTARDYCDGQREALLVGGVAVVETWETEAVPRLAALILGE
jgi:HK97 family phage portal protein